MECKCKCGETQWHEEEEIFLEKLHIQSYDLYEYWNKRATIYKRTYVRFNLPSIFISGINTVLALLLSKYIEQGIVSAVNASLSMITAIIGSVNMLLRVNERYSLALISAMKYHRLCIKISKELSIPQTSRTLSGVNFVNECYAEYNNIFEHADPMHNSDVVQRLIYTHYLLSDHSVKKLPDKQNRVSKFLNNLTKKEHYHGFRPLSDILDQSTHLSTRRSFDSETYSSQHLKKMSMDLFPANSNIYPSDDGWLDDKYNGSQKRSEDREPTVSKLPFKSISGDLGVIVES